MASDETRGEGDEPERDEDDETGEGEGASPSILGGADVPGVETIEDSPRNRAERRAQLRRERRGLVPEGSALVADPAGGPRRLPPKTVSGKSSADEVPPWARSFVAWMSAHRSVLLGGATAAVLVSGGAVAYTLMRESRAARAAELYHDAVEVQSAPLRAADAPADPPGAPPRRVPTFADRTARSRAALEGFRRAEHEGGDAPIAPLARLSEAGTLYDLGRFAEAKPVFEALVGSFVAGQEARVLEGLGFTLEALNDQPGALRRFEEMGRLDDGAYRDLAQLHQARVLHKMGQEPRSKDVLHGLIERLSRASTGDATGPTSSGSVLEQARLLLRDIDPADPAARRAQMPMDPEALMRMLQQQTGGRIQPPRGMRRPPASAPAPAEPPAAPSTAPSTAPAPGPTGGAH